jgi:hypothetical protein
MRGESDDDARRDAELRRMVTPPMPMTGKGKAKAPANPEKRTTGTGRS